MFVGILALLILMSATGYFKYFRSPVEDKNVYTGKGVGGTDSEGLQMRNIYFDEPTQTPTPSPDTSTPTPTPTPDNSPTNTPTPSPTLIIEQSP